MVVPTLAKQTIQNLYLHSVETYSDEVAFSYVDEGAYTFAEVDRQSTALAKALRRLGLAKGDRVALLAENGPVWSIVYLTVAALGAVVVPILPDFHKSEIHHIIRNAGCRILFISSRLAHKVSEIRSKEMDWVAAMDNGPLPLDQLNVVNIRDLIEGAFPQKKKEPHPLRFPVEEDDLAEILYTSGTTGHSKGVMLTHKNIVSNALSAVRMIELSHDDRLVSILPQSHAYECTCGFLAPFMQGAKVYYIKGLPTAQTLLPAVQKVKPTHILSVPLIMEKIYKKKVLAEINARSFSKMAYKITPKLIYKIAGKKLYQAFGGKLKIMIFGGAAMPLEVEEFLNEAGFPYISGYGLTEASPLLTVNPVGHVKKQSAGKAVPSVNIRIVDVDPETGIGEIQAKGPNIMKGYYKNEEATQKAITKDGWLITGDRGYVDEEGYLFIKGRSKNLIVGSSGENIYPEEIEFHLSQSPYVLESLVYEKEGRIVARVHPDYDALEQHFHISTLDGSQAVKTIEKLLEEIRAEVNDKVAGYSRIHKIIEQSEEFEKTPTKKIKRYLYTD
ncbi:MAG TPA: AMP-binding protein [bacterium]|nr:AMP-binding protein [bacterium]